MLPADLPERIDLLRRLFERQGLTYRQVAQRYDTTVGAIAGTLYRARQQGQVITVRPFTPAPSPRRVVASAAPVPTVVDRRPLKPDAWAPLPGSTPVRLRDARGCCWPLGDGPPFLWCNEPVDDTGRYCAAHTRISRAPAWTAQQKGKGR